MMIIPTIDRCVYYNDKTLPIYSSLLILKQEHANKIAAFKLPRQTNSFLHRE